MSDIDKLNLAGAAALLKNYQEEKYADILRFFGGEGYNWQLSTVGHEIQDCQHYINGIVLSLKNLERHDKFPTDLTDKAKFTPFLFTEQQFAFGAEDVENLGRLLTLMEDHTQALLDGKIVCMARTQEVDICDFRYLYARSEKEAVDCLFRHYGIEIPTISRAGAREQD